MKRLQLLTILLCTMFGIWSPQIASSQWIECTGNETWISVASGLEGEALKGVKMDGDLYIVHKTADPVTTPGDTIYAISRYDGASWSNVTTFTLRNNSERFWEPSVRAFAAHDGQLYLGGTFSLIEGGAPKQHIIRWDGTQWSAADGGLDIFRVYSLGVYRGKLYGGIATNVNGSGLRAWDGTSWSSTELNGIVHDLLVWEGDLYAGGEFKGNGSTISPGVARFDGATWSPVGSGVGGAVEDLIGYRDELFVFGRWISIAPNTIGQIVRWNGSAWSNGAIILNESITSIDWAIHNDQIYIVGTIDSSRQGRDSLMMGRPFSARYDGTQWQPVSTFNTAANSVVEYNGDLYAVGSFTSSCGTPVGHIALLCSEKNCGAISGTVYHDMDGNCTQDGGDPGLRKRMIEVRPGPVYAMTDSNGNYTVHLPKGDYNVALAPFLYWNQNCPSGTSGYDVKLASANAAEKGIDFGTTAIPDIVDLRVSVAVSRARVGRPLSYAITYENVGTVAMNGTLKFFHDPTLTFEAAKPTVSRYTAPVAEWDFSDLQVGEARTVFITLTVSQSAQLNSEICGYVMIEPYLNDLGLDNRDTTCVRITGSYDPNDISVSPFGIEDNGEISSTDSVLSYTVRFQNTGNDTAFKVVVVDTLSSHLNVKSIKLGAASHPFTFKISGNGILSWAFDEIMLPDSGANEQNSHGFFKYSVNLKPNLGSGTEIPNRVSIYFDFNAPVPTNTVISLINAPSSVPAPQPSGSMLAYPNPAHGMVYIHADVATGARLVLRNIMGEVIGTYAQEGTADVAIDVSGMAAGAYFVEVPTRNGVLVERVTVVR